MKRKEDVLADRLFMSTVSRDAQKYDDMYGYAKEFIQSKVSDFSCEERNMLSVAFKRSIQNHRKAIQFV